MKTTLERSPERERFIVSDVEADLRPLVAAFEFAETREGFVREFPPSSVDVDSIFSRFQACFEPMLHQLSGAEPVPWSEALVTFANTVGSAADWWLVGSAALAVRGVPVEPHDVDLVVSEEDFHRVNELLADYLVEPPSESEGWIARYFSRAFIGARIEWVAGVRDRIDAPTPADFGPVAESRREKIEWQGLELHVPPINLQLEVSKRRGLRERARAIETFIAAGG